jgi:hypothetical protein
VKLPHVHAAPPSTLEGIASEHLHHTEMYTGPHVFSWVPMFKHTVRTHVLSAASHNFTLTKWPQRKLGHLQLGHGCGDANDRWDLHQC